MLNEAKLSRVYRHMQNREIPIVIMSAFRNEYPHNTNVKRNTELAAKVRNNGYGFFYVDGCWDEEVEDSEEKIRVSEDSLFIIGSPNDNGKLKGLAKKWMVEYNQDAVLFKPEDETHGYLIFQNGDVTDLGVFTPTTAEEGFTKLRRSHDASVFSFEQERDAPGFLGRMGQMKTPAESIRENMNAVKTQSIARSGRTSMAYWISPRGEIIDTSNDVHISYVVSDPTRFGLKQEYIEQTYEKYGEPVGQEGKAREEIMNFLIKRGWIRLRLYASRNNSQWSITINRLNNRNKDYLQQWAEHQMGADDPLVRDSFAAVRIEELSTGRSITNYVVRDLSQYKHLEESRKLKFRASLQEMSKLYLYRNQ